MLSSLTMIVLHFGVLLLFLIGSSTINAAELTGAEIISAITSDQWDEAVANKIVVTIDPSY